MNPPDALLNAIHRAEQALHDHPQYDLNLGFRQLIWAAFGPKYGTVPTDERPPAYIKRVKLAINTMHKVLPSWDRVLASDRTPQQALALAEGVLKQNVSINDGWKARNDMWLHCDEIANAREDLQIVLGVGYGCVQAPRQITTPPLVISSQYMALSVNASFPSQTPNTARAMTTMLWANATDRPNKTASRFVPLVPMRYAAVSVLACPGSRAWSAPRPTAVGK